MCGLVPISFKYQILDKDMGILVAWNLCVRGFLIKKINISGCILQIIKHYVCIRHYYTFLPICSVTLFFRCCVYALHLLHWTTNPSKVGIITAPHREIFIVLSTSMHNCKHWRAKTWFHILTLLHFWLCDQGKVTQVILPLWVLVSLSTKWIYNDIKLRISAKIKCGKIPIGWELLSKC